MKDKFFESKKKQQSVRNLNYEKSKHFNSQNLKKDNLTVAKVQTKETIANIEDKFNHYLNILDKINHKTQQAQYQKLINIKKIYPNQLEMLRSKKKIQIQDPIILNIQNKKEEKQEKIPISNQMNSKENTLKSSIKSLNPSIKLESNSTRNSNSSTKSDFSGKYQPNFSLSLKKIPSQTYDSVQIQDFAIFGKKGSGRLGQVLLTVHKKTGAIFALKKILKSQILSNQLVQYLIKEIRVQASLNNPNIIKIYGVFDDNQNVYLILQYAQQGSLDQCMKKRNYHKSNQNLFSEKILSFYLRNIMNALQALHSKQIMHRDLKPENIVITNDVCKLCDFGWATFNPEKQRRATYCGTLDYAAPQIFQGKEYDLSVDLWQFGVMAYEMATGKLPFYMKSEKETLEKVINYNDDLSFPCDTSLLVKDFILKFLQKNPEKRKCISEMLKHTLITKYLTVE